MDSKSRFSSRVDDYIKYRPGYPAGVIDTLVRDCGLSPASSVADVGAGTGLLARLFLDFGCRVYGIEPNTEMRAAASRLLGHYPHFSNLDGSAESSGLSDSSVEFVSAGQAFHWFDAQRARSEFRRILKPDGWCVLVWNERRTDATPFLQAYEDLLQQFAKDYNQVNHRNVEMDPEIIPGFFGGPYQMARFDNEQVFDFDGVRGRLLSSSYAPEPGQVHYEPMIAQLRSIFDKFQQAGKVSFIYDMRMFYGKMQ